MHRRSGIHATLGLSELLALQPAAFQWPVLVDRYHRGCRGPDGPAREERVPRGGFVWMDVPCRLSSHFTVSGTKFSGVFEQKLRYA